MKPKTLKKKLSLTKTTVSNLEDKKMKSVLGGRTDTCNTFCDANSYISRCMCDTNFTCDDICVLHITRRFDMCQASEAIPC